ncbi:hypothetical protein PENSPDRAFT_76251 [Peniophora sp. CONT]|nr:hypothetical protein PENSPDRAFT_76251 [Peniophora sp. CONT]
MASSAIGRILEVDVLPTTENTIGAIFIGWGVSAVLYGMFVLQAWEYFHRYPTDNLYHKALVASIWVFETIHQAFVGHYCWEYTVKGYNSGQVLFVKRTVWSLSALVLLGGIIGTLVKLYFAFRVYRLGKGSNLATGLICVMALAQLGTATAYAVKSSMIALTELVTLKGLGSTSLALGAATDIVTALTLSFYLNGMRTGYRRSEGLINKLIGFSVRTGALTSAVSLAVLILYQTMPGNFVFISFYFIVCKMYSNSCLATLNVRRPSAGRETEFESSHSRNGQAVMMTSRLRFGTNSAHDERKPEGVRTLDIGVSQEIAVMRDEPDAKVSYADFGGPVKGQNYAV